MAQFTQGQTFTLDPPIPLPEDQEDFDKGLFVPLASFENDCGEHVLDTMGSKKRRKPTIMERRAIKQVTSGSSEPVEAPQAPQPSPPPVQSRKRSRAVATPSGRATRARPQPPIQDEAGPSRIPVPQIRERDQVPTETTIIPETSQTVDRPQEPESQSSLPATVVQEGNEPIATPTPSIQVQIPPPVRSQTTAGTSSGAEVLTRADLLLFWQQKEEEQEKRREEERKEKEARRKIKEEEAKKEREAREQKDQAILSALAQQGNLLAALTQRLMGPAPIDVAPIGGPIPSNQAALPQRAGEGISSQTGGSDATTPTIEQASVPKEKESGDKEHEKEKSAD